MTAIDKRPVAGRVAVHRLGVAGDRQCDPKHGGELMAVYAYAAEDAAWWAVELDRPITPGRFGENLTTEGVDVTGAVVGERWRIGTVELQVTSPRTPCRTFQGFWDVPRLAKRFTEHGAPGAYLAVPVEGELAAGDPVQVVHRPAHGLTIGQFFAAWTGSAPELIEAFADCPDVPASERESLRRRLRSVDA